MEFQSFSAGPDDDGRRIDRILKVIFKDNPEVRYQEAMRKKLIRVNDTRVAPDYRVRAGDSISVADFLLCGKSPAASAPRQTACKGSGDGAEPLRLETRFRNKHIWLLDKPYGIPVQAANGCPLSIAGLIAAKQTGSCGRQSIAFTPAPLHRLDRYTTGLLAVSQSMEGARWFSGALQEHRIQKTYLGITQGIPAGRERWQDKLSPAAGYGAFHTVRQDSGGIPAITEAVPLAAGMWHSMPVALVQFRIETGRKHQIRAQSAAHGFPLIGDSAYGARPLPGGRAFYLHAVRMGIPSDNPLSLPESVTCPLPPEFKDFLAAALIKWEEQIIL